MNDSTQFDIEADKLLLDLTKKVINITNDWSVKHQKNGVAVERTDEAIKAALSQLHNLYMQGKIDELKKIAAIWNDNEIHPPQQLIDRIATLEAQLTLKGGKDV